VTPDALADLDLRGVSGALARREVSSLEATEAYLARIERHDRVLQSYLCVMAEPARARAKAMDEELARGARRGPLHGVPLALKDLCAVAGVPMSAGSRVLGGHVPRRDACVTERLWAAGAVVLGKLAMYELAFGRPTSEGPFPTGRNPWDPTRDTTGSSSGSGAAVAAGLCAGALGSDTGGSIRNPAARCGIVGLKPTYGLVSRRGVVPLCWSLDTVGPMTRDVWGAAVVLQAIAGRDAGDPTTRGAPATPPDYTVALEAGVRGTRLGVLRRFYVDWPGLHPEGRRTALEAFDVLRREGASLEDVDAPALDLALPAWVTWLAEAYEIHREAIRARPDDFAQTTRPRLWMGALVTAADHLRARRLAARLRAQALGLLERVEALVFPGMSGPAPRPAEIDPTQVMPAGARYTVPWNLLGLPALVVPCGFTPEGLPLSIQIVGRPFDEPTVLRVARAYERATEWHRRRPDPARWRA
jgi:aspartyl-tRNA(Asn)/glutamyl-tRNA(Gln) amidotransferase subunit A